jgi:hypothetical protein
MHYTHILLQTKLNEHLIVPMNELKAELFDSLRRREINVTEDDLAKSKEALARMLREYSNTAGGSPSSSKI